MGWGGVYVSLQIFLNIETDRINSSADRWFYYGRFVKRVSIPVPHSQTHSFLIQFKNVLTLFLLTKCVMMGSFIILSYASAKNIDSYKF